MYKELAESMTKIRETSPEIYAGYFCLLGALQLHMKINHKLLTKYEQNNPYKEIIQCHINELDETLSVLPSIPPLRQGKTIIE